MLSAVITGSVIDRKDIRESPHQPGTAGRVRVSHVMNCSAHGAGSTPPNCVRDSGKNHRNHQYLKVRAVRSVSAAGRTHVQ